MRGLFRDFRGRLITTESVLSEAVCLLGPSFPRQKPALDFVLAGGAELVSMMPALLKRCAHLMSKYSDVPLDYADATLVAVGETLGIRDILTLDRRGFPFPGIRRGVLSGSSPMRSNRTVPP